MACKICGNADIGDQALCFTCGDDNDMCYLCGAKGTCADTVRCESCLVKYNGRCEHCNAPNGGVGNCLANCRR